MIITRSLGPFYEKYTCASSRVSVATPPPQPLEWEQHFFVAGGKWK